MYTIFIQKKLTKSRIEKVGQVSLHNFFFLILLNEVRLAIDKCNFIKHLRPCNSSTSYSIFHRHLILLNQLKQFSTNSSHHYYQQCRHILTTATNSNWQLKNHTTLVTDESFTAPYLSVRISCPRILADESSESLMCFGAGSTTIDEQDSCQSDNEQHGAFILKEGMCVRIWIGSTFDVNQDVKDCIFRAADSVELKEIPNYEVEMHDHTDWIKQSQESFHPVEITEGLWIVPEWRDAPDPKAINIILNPGLAFGTGEHPTTRLCLLMLHRLIKGGEHFLDYGTGSGVLAIATLKFGADLSVGFDIEPQAITSSRHNAALNDIAPDKLLLILVPSMNGPDFENEISLRDNDLYNSKIISEKEKYDVVVANILLYPLLDLAEQIVSYAKPGAIVGLSGIITEQVPSVKEQYSQFLDEIFVSMMNDWACISGFKKTKPGTS